MKQRIKNGGITVNSAASIPSNPTRTDTGTVVD